MRRSLSSRCLYVVFFVPLLCMIFSAPGCSKRESDEIKIGAILPLTGEAAQWGVDAKRAIQLAVDEINEKTDELLKVMEGVSKKLYEGVGGAPPQDMPDMGEAMGGDGEPSDGEGENDNKDEKVVDADYKVIDEDKD